MSKVPEQAATKSFLRCNSHSKPQQDLGVNAICYTFTINL